MKEPSVRGFDGGRGSRLDGVGMVEVVVGVDVGVVTVTCVVTVLSFGFIDPGTAIMTVTV